MDTETKIINFFKLENKNIFSIEEIIKQIKLNKDQILKALSYLEVQGYVKINKKEISKFYLTTEGKNYLKNGFPEENLIKKIKKGINQVKDLDEIDKKIAIMWAKKKGLIHIKDAKLFVLKEFDLKIKDILNNLENHKEQELNEALKRNLILKKSIKKINILVFDKIKEKKENLEDKILNLTKEMLQDGSYINKQFVEYDVNMQTKQKQAAKIHILTDITEFIKDIFISMGFEEMKGEVVEKAFWNFDALFQPQDHPARELADTFYINKKMNLEKEGKLIEKVAKAHEKGWDYIFDINEAKKSVLRTHNTATSARYMSKQKNQEDKKYFSISRVYRNEAVDFKHLAEFNQVEGIVISKDANFSNLLGFLKEFYLKLGFNKIRFRPSYFPYTEPSVEIEVFFEKKGEWIELGGAGIMRPEVSKPLYGGYPVLAWGLSLERPLMILYDLEDIRTFYKNDIDFLKNRKLFKVIKR